MMICYMHAIVYATCAHRSMYEIVRAKKINIFSACFVCLFATLIVYYYNLITCALMCYLIIIKECVY